MLTLGLASEYMTEKLSQTVIGQRKALKKITGTLCENFEAYASGEPIKRGNVLLMGPSGSGKTEIARSISKVLEIPFTRVTMADFTLTGYRGRDPQEIVTVDFKRSISRKQIEAVRNMLKRFLIRKKVAEAIGESSLSEIEFKLGLEFCALTVFFEEDEVIESFHRKLGNPAWLKRLLDNLRSSIREVERFSKFLDPGKNPAENMEKFFEKPFGMVFIDEIDKILIKERDDGAAFYRPLQQFILTMIEGAKVTTEDESIDTSHISFILAGAFSQNSPEEFIPELKGRLPVRAEVRKLNYRDYLKIMEIKGLEIPEAFRNRLVKVEPDAIAEMAKVCQELNEREYLGARRIREVVAKVNMAINVELQNLSSLPVIVNGSFVRWAISYEPPEEEPEFTPAELTVAGSSPNGSGELKKRTRDILINSMVKFYEEIFRESGKLDRIKLSAMEKSLLMKDSQGKSVLEYLIERKVIKEVSDLCFLSIKKKLGTQAARRIRKKVKVIKKDPDEVEF